MLTEQETRVLRNAINELRKAAHQLDQMAGGVAGRAPTDAANELTAFLVEQLKAPPADAAKKVG